MTEQIITIRGSDPARLDAYITAREGQVRVSYKMSRYGHLTPFSGAPYLTAEEWGRVFEAVGQCLRKESEG
jgi:hypothetical protein